MVVDKNGTPQDLNAILIGNEGAANGTANTTQTTFNKVRIDENRFK